MQLTYLGERGGVGEKRVLGSSIEATGAVAAATRS
jgi:hypothetical protein